MICDACGEALRVSHSYSTPKGRTQRLECVVCLLVHTGMVVLVNVDPARGEGAAALAKRLTNGEEAPIG